jgi:transposase
MEKLTSEEIAKLKALHKNERDKRVCDRIKAVLMHNDGHSYIFIAKTLLLDETTIARYVEGYIKEQKLKPTNGGSQSKLSAEQTAELILFFKEITYFNVKKMIQYVFKKYSVQYTRSGFTAWLHSNGFRYKKPKSVPFKHLEQEQKEFIEKLNELSANDEAIYFLDSSHPQYQSKPAYGWIYKGENKALPSTSKQTRINITGIYNSKTGDVDIIESEKVNSQVVIELIEKIKPKDTNQNIYIALDNAAFHKSWLIKNYLAENKNIHFLYLPPYSPNLNLIERLWKYMHKQVTYNQCYSTFSTFKRKILDFFDSIDDYADDLKKLLTFKFQTIPSAIIKPAK